MTQQQDSAAPAADFDTLASLLLSEGAMSQSPSELHGLIAGQLAAGARLDNDTLLKVLAKLIDVSAFNDQDTKLALCQLYKQTLEQYEASDFSFEILLPDDDQALSQRAECLGNWCAGFLTGFGLQIGKAGEKLSSEAQESLRDLAQIAQIVADSEADSDEEEGDLMEVQEYVRGVAMLLFNECNAPVKNAKADKPQTIH